MANNFANAINSNIGASNSGATNILTVTNPSDTASSQALVNVTVGGTTAGDAFTTYTVSGTTNWSQGIDNSVTGDPLVIAASTALGTTNVWSATTAGEITMPLQPAFLAYKSSISTNVIGDATIYTIIPDTEVFDQSADYNNGTGTFTAPVTGRYFLRSKVFVQGGTAISGANFVIATTNRNFTVVGGTNPFPVTTVSVSLQNSAFADMTAGDTATITIITTDSGGKVDDVFGSGTQNYTYIAGYLVC